MGLKCSRSGAVLVAFSPAIWAPSSNSRQPNHHKDLQGYHHQMKLVDDVIYMNKALAKLEENRPTRSRSSRPT
ncbi:uncharacterized protein LOC120458227 isoform X1 [Drosophila santomea]|uniref:uncharacterized protein LOC120458227 isoform X1 n=1 Tax=Drosophila santomea TaxID=129105 RepID=UPI00195442B0|nr:uncharacterized protein LOC120458227 isoform X1 [Drosophila santomea]